MVPRKGLQGQPRSLAQKLGIHPESKVFFYNLPSAYYSWIDIQKDDLPVPEIGGCNFAHLFLTRTDELESWLSELRHTMENSGMIWISWYKKSSGIPSELTEDIIRDTALALGLVDVKVCSINKEWSALKLVIRKELR